MNSVYDPNADEEEPFILKPRVFSTDPDDDPSDDKSIICHVFRDDKNNGVKGKRKPIKSPIKVQRYEPLFQVLPTKFSSDKKRRSNNLPVSHVDGSMTFGNFCIKPIMKDQIQEYEEIQIGKDDDNLRELNAIADQPKLNLQAFEDLSDFNDLCDLESKKDDAGNLGNLPPTAQVVGTPIARVKDAALYFDSNGHPCHDYDQSTISPTQTLDVSQDVDQVIDKPASQPKDIPKNDNGPDLSHYQPLDNVQPKPQPDDNLQRTRSNLYDSDMPVMNTSQHSQDSGEEDIIYSDEEVPCGQRFPCRPSDTLNRIKDFVQKEKYYITQMREEDVDMSTAHFTTVLKQHVLELKIAMSLELNRIDEMKAEKAKRQALQEFSQRLTQITCIEKCVHDGCQNTNMNSKMRQMPCKGHSICFECVFEHTIMHESSICLKCPTCNVVFKKEELTCNKT